MKIFSFETLPSTQDTARDYLAEGKAPLPFAIMAASQTKGRGRGGNQWVSSIHGNLYTSIVVDIAATPVRDVGQYSFLAAVALMDVFGGCGIKNACNKWPNDILVDGKKIAGILLESDIGPNGLVTSLIIGLGVNLSASPEGAVSVHDITGTIIAPHQFLVDLGQAIEGFLQIFREQGFAPIREKWISKIYGLGQDIRVRLPDETFQGVFEGLDEQGALLVRFDGKIRKIHSGDVFFDLPAHQK